MAETATEVGAGAEELTGADEPAATVDGAGTGLGVECALGVLIAEGGGTGTGARKLLPALDAGGGVGTDAAGADVGPMGITIGISVV